ncbi:MAG: rhodanese-like domain-containing protein [Cyanobacteria bacterium P01_G01_bin.67]
MLSSKTTLTSIIVLVLYFSSFGCHQAELRSEEWKQSQITIMYRQYSQEFPQVAGIAVEELQQLQQQNQELILVDVRSPEERAVSFIPGAISTEEFERNLAQYQQATIVAYCTIGYRSGKYAQKMQQRGIDILNLEGSLLAWSHVQGKLVDAQGATNQVHIFGRQWQLTAADYEAIW